MRHDVRYVGGRGGEGMKRTLNPMVLLAILALVIGMAAYGLNSWSGDKQDDQVDRIAESFAEGSGG